MSHLFGVGIRLARVSFKKGRNGPYPSLIKGHLRNNLPLCHFNELVRRGFETGYAKTPAGFEVDFLAWRAGGDEELIQVCADPSDADTLAREMRALADAASTHPRATRRLLTLTQDGLPGALPAGVHAQPAYEWLLENSAPN